MLWFLFSQKVNKGFIWGSDFCEVSKMDTEDENCMHSEQKPKAEKALTSLELNLGCQSWKQQSASTVFTSLHIISWLICFLCCEEIRWWSRADSAAEQTVIRAEGTHIWVSGSTTNHHTSSTLSWSWHNATKAAPIHRSLSKTRWIELNRPNETPTFQITSCKTILCKTMEKKCDFCKQFLLGVEKHCSSCAAGAQ